MKMLSQESIDKYRREADKTPPRAIQPLPKKEGRLDIAAILSCPRLAWTDTWGCVQEVFSPLGIGVVKHTGVFWGQSLSRLMEDCLALNMDYVITLDYDSLFTSEHVVELIRTMHEHPEIDALVPVQVKRESNVSMFTLRDENGNFKTDATPEELAQPLLKIATGHFGLTILRCSSLAKLERPWFCHVPNEHGEWINGHIDEDVYFWLRAEEEGWNVYLANQVRIGHIQTVASWPGADFRPRFQYLSDWNKREPPV